MLVIVAASLLVAAFSNHLIQFGQVLTSQQKSAAHPQQDFRMQLRPELMPPALDSELVDRLSKLASQLDGSPDEAKRVEFNRLAGTDIPLAEFQGIYRGENHEDYVRRVLSKQQIKPASRVTEAELAEVVWRAMPQNQFGNHEAYMAIFDANVPLEKASNLIFYPRDYDVTTNTWGGGRSITEYDPSPEQIVKWALSSGDDNSDSR